MVSETVIAFPQGQGSAIHASERGLPAARCRQKGVRLGLARTALAMGFSTRGSTPASPKSVATLHLRPTALVRGEDGALKLDGELLAPHNRMELCWLFPNALKGGTSRLA